MISESPITLTLALFISSFLPVAMQLSLIKDMIHKMSCTAMNGIQKKLICSVRVNRFSQYFNCHN